MNSEAKDLRDAANALIADTDQSLTELRKILAEVPDRLLGPAHVCATQAVLAAATFGREIEAAAMLAAVVGIEIEMTRRAEQFRAEAESTL